MRLNANPARSLLNRQPRTHEWPRKSNAPCHGKLMTSNISGLPALPRSPAASSPAVRASMRGNRIAQSRPETTLQQALVRLGLTHFAVHSPLPGTPDIAFKEEKVAVFVHGCYWHRCPYCSPHFPVSNQYYWAAKFTRNKARDRAVRKELRTMDWVVVTVWECKVLKNPVRQARRVREWVRKPRKLVLSSADN